MDYIITLVICYLLYRFFKSKTASKISRRIEKWIRDNPEYFLNDSELRHYRKYGNFDDYDDSEDYLSTRISQFRTDNRFISTVILVKMNEILQNKFGYSLNEKEKTILIGAFHALPDEKLDMLYRYIKNHPFISMFLANKLAELYHKKKAAGEHITAAEIAFFIWTAKTLADE